MSTLTRVAGRRSYILTTDGRGGVPIPPTSPAETWSSAFAQHTGVDAVVERPGRDRQVDGRRERRDDQARRSRFVVRGLVAHPGKHSARSTSGPGCCAGAFVRQCRSKSVAASGAAMVLSASESAANAARIKEAFRGPVWRVRQGAIRISRDALSRVATGYDDILVVTPSGSRRANLAGEVDSSSSCLPSIADAFGH